MLDLVMWLMVAFLVWYLNNSYKNEKREREIQNKNNLEMETIREPESQSPVGGKPT